MSKGIRAAVVSGAAAAIFMGGLALRYALVRRPLPNYPTPESLIREPDTDIRAERQPDGSFIIRWKVGADRVTIYAGSAPEAIDYTHPLTVIMGSNEACLQTAAGQARPYFEVHFSDGRRLPVAERRLALRSAVNLRDIGGYLTASGRRTRWGMVYRSGMLHRFTPEDMAALDALGIRTVCDLRTEREAHEKPDQLPEGAQYIHRPLYSGEESSNQLRRMLLHLGRIEALLTEVYTQGIVDEKAHLLGAMFRDWAEPGALPALVHCTAGKDRTGVAIALLLMLLGVPDQTIRDDYSLSNYAYEVYRASLDDNMHRVQWLGIRREDLLPMLTANPATIQAVLDHVRTRYGGVQAYLTGPANVSAAALAWLQEALLI